MTFHGLRHTYVPEQYKKLTDAGNTDEQAKKQLSKWTGHERADVMRIYLPNGSDVIERKKYHKGSGDDDV